jgi:hypothetical protein
MFLWCRLYRAGKNLKHAVETLVEKLAEIFDEINEIVGVDAILKNNRAFVKKPFYLIDKPGGRRCFRYFLYRGKP